MSESREHRELDPRIHAVLDGEISPSETAAFEGELRPGTAPGYQLETLKHLGAWFRATRSRAPSNLFRDVERALERERALDARIPSSPVRGRRRFPRPALRWAWVPAAVMAAAVILLTVIPHRRAHGPSDGFPQPSERAMSTSPPAASETAGTPAENSVRYVFTVSAEDAHSVCLAGDFNQWRVCEAPLERVEGDTWSIAVELPPGRHEYMFVIDGKWVTDPNAIGHVKDDFGNTNAVVVV